MNAWSLLETLYGVIRVLWNNNRWKKCLHQPSLHLTRLRLQCRMPWNAENANVRFARPASHGFRVRVMTQRHIVTKIKGTFLLNALVSWLTWGKQLGILKVPINIAWDVNFDACAERDRQVSRYSLMTVSDSLRTYFRVIKQVGVKASQRWNQSKRGKSWKLIKGL